MNKFQKLHEKIGSPPTTLLATRETVNYLIQGPTNVDGHYSYLEIQKLHNPNDCDLVEYSSLPDEFDIESLWTGIIVTNESDILVQTQVSCNRELTTEELEKLMKECQGQYSDGWGEGYEQFDYQIDDVFVSPWFYGQELTCYKVNSDGSKEVVLKIS